MFTATECIVEYNTCKSCILLTSRCSSITVFSNSSCSSLEWNRMKTLYGWHIWSSSGERDFSKGSGHSKSLSSIKFFLRFRSSNLPRSFLHLHIRNGGKQNKHWIQIYLKRYYTTQDFGNTRIGVLLTIQRRAKATEMSTLWGGAEKGSPSPSPMLGSKMGKLHISILIPNN